MIRSKHRECPVCSYPFSNADEGIMPYIGSPIFKKRCPNCGLFFEYRHNEEFDDYYYMILEPHMWDPFKITGKLPEIKKIIENDPATVILWEDGTKTVAKCQDGDVFDFEKGVLICSLKKLIGNKATNELLNQTEKEKTNISAKKQKQKSCITCQYEKINYDSYPCDSCLRRYWRDGSLLNWEPRK